jgi:3-deoxy-D-manno-octulosonate 8-phosphate phosphatase KdsC-like HAD superfamily phosphatase
MSLTQVFKEKGKLGMVIISDVDGVHTSPGEGVTLSARLDEEFGSIFTLRDGIQFLELVPANSSEQLVIFMANYEGKKIMESYKFHTPDGMGVIDLLSAGLRTIITSGRDSPAVKARFDTLVRNRFGDKLGAETHLGIRDKLAHFQSLGIDFSNTIFIADGHQDAPLLQAVSDAGGIAVATADCEDEARDASDAQTAAKGGEGAFAELALECLSFIR